MTGVQTCALPIFWASVARFSTWAGEEEALRSAGSGVGLATARVVPRARKLVIRLNFILWEDWVGDEKAERRVGRSGEEVREGLNLFTV